MSIYKEYTDRQVAELNSNYLVDTWSYTKLSSFARNEKAFEMREIYGIRDKSSASTVAGQAYHFALDRYFFARQKGDAFDLADLQTFAFDYIEDYNASWWKLQKTTPTIEECKLKATKVVTQLLENFFSEISTYIDDIKLIIDVEVSCDQYLTINGVDIPLRCKGKIDLVYEDYQGNIVITDHKSKSVLSDEEEIKLSIGRQAITYVHLYEAEKGIVVNKIRFIENKYSKNKDRSLPQLVSFPIMVTDDVRRLYEALLYEPLKRMISAVSDPDYVYLINESDSFTDKADIFAFWARTMICEVEEFNVPDNKKDMVSKRLKKIRDASLATISPNIIKKFQENASQFIQYDLSNKNMSQQEKIEHVLRTFGIITNVAYVFEGYSSKTFLINVSAGTKLSSIKSHSLDLANALDVERVRISKDLIVHAGKSYLAIETVIENDRILYWDKSKLIGQKIPIGEDNFGNVITWDLNNHSTPHCLVGGSTGSGKSVELISILKYAEEAGITEITILDPKFEFVKYSDKYRVVNEIIEIEEEIKMLVDDMNTKIKNNQSSKHLVIFDEFADAVMQSRKGNQLDIREDVEVGFYKQSKIEVMMGAKPQVKTKNQKTGQLKSLNENLQMLLQKGRSSGFRIICAAQRADTSVINGTSKVNFPVQICFKVDKQVSSMVMIDEPGAEGLRGRGDGLFKSPQYPDTIRFQGYYYED